MLELNQTKPTITHRKMEGTYQYPTAITRLQVNKKPLPVFKKETTSGSWRPSKFC